VNCTGLTACQRLCELLSIICRRKDVDKIPLYVVISFSCHAANRENENAAERKTTPTSRRRTAHRTTPPPPHDGRHPLSRTANSHPSDLAAVKYEMLRQAHAEKQAVSRTPGIVVFPRPSFTKRNLLPSKMVCRITSPVSWSAITSQAPPEVMNSSRAGKPWSHH